MSGAARRFSPLAVGTACAIALLSFALAFVMVAYGDDLGEVRSAGTDTFSYSAIGHRAFAAFLERRGLEVDSKRTPAPARIGPDRPLVAAEPRVLFLDADGWIETLRDLAAARDAPLVVVLPEWQGRPGPDGRWIETAFRYHDDLVALHLDELLDQDPEHPAVVPRTVASTSSCTDDLGRELAVDLESPRLLELRGDGLEPLVRCAEGALIARDPRGLWIVSDPDLLNNHGLIRGENASAVALLVERLGAAGVVFDETIHGLGRAPGVVAELLRFPLVFPVLHGVLLLGLVVWSGSVRFGKPRRAAPPIADGKRVLIDNAAELLSLGGHAPRALESYFERTVRAVAAHYFLPGGLALPQLVERLQPIAAARGVVGSLAALEAGVQRLAAGHAHTERAVRLATRIHRWRQEMTHGAGRSPRARS